MECNALTAVFTNVTIVGVSFEMCVSLKAIDISPLANVEFAGRSFLGGRLSRETVEGADASFAVFGVLCIRWRNHSRATFLSSYGGSYSSHAVAESTLNLLDLSLDQ
jgi:hypothetical protein